MPYVTSEMNAIMQNVGQILGDESVVESIHFSSTALTMIRHVMMSGGIIVTDTTLALADIDGNMAERLGITTECFIDEPQVVVTAEQKRKTRAEVALDYALNLPGLKMIAVGSAPMALSQLLKRAQADALGDVVVLAAPTGFASVVQLKERIWESDLASIVVRGKKGGASVVASVINALMMEAIKQQNL